MSAYLEAVEKYRSAVGEKHPQYISTLANLGMCFQAAALEKGPNGMERRPLLERAVETFTEVQKLRSESQVILKWVVKIGSGYTGRLADRTWRFSVLVLLLDF